MQHNGLLRSDGGFIKAGGGNRPAVNIFDNF
jgi:hypothetical protein